MRSYSSSDFPQADSFINTCSVEASLNYFGFDFLKLILVHSETSCGSTL